MAFSNAHIEALRVQFGSIKTVNPDQLPKFHKMFDAMSDAMLKQVATAKINFLSSLAVNACGRRGVIL
jgi:hypothetical protein